MCLRFFAAVMLHVVAVSAGCGDETTGPDGDDGTASSGAASGGGAGGGGGSGGDGGAPCDDSGPDPKMHTAGTCSNLGETALVAYCNEAIATLDPGVAYDAISCLANVCLRGPGCTTQEYQQKAEECLIAALAAACPDVAADASCGELETLCAATTAECHAFVDGMTARTRAELLTCAQTDCTADLGACVEQVLTP